jgi:hypothetical protein
MRVAQRDLESATRRDADVLEACSTSLGIVDTLKMSNEFRDRPMVRCRGENDSVAHPPAGEPCECFTIDVIKKCTVIGPIANAASAAAAASADAELTELSDRFGLDSRKAWTVLKPETSCVGELQLTSLVNQALDGGAIFVDNYANALQQLRRLQLDSTLLHLDGTVEGLVRALAYTHACTIFVYACPLPILITVVYL